MPGRYVHGITVIAISAAAAATATADVVELVSDRDNTLYEAMNGILSNGAGDHMFTGLNLSNDLRRAVFRFDLAGAVPPGSTINSVTLQLYMSRTVAGTRTVTLHRTLADWGEGASHAEGEEGGGAISEPGDATWIHTFYDSDFWENMGGDFEPTPSASEQVGGLGFYSWGSTLEMVADVQAWVDSTHGNFGWLLLGDENTVPSAKRFDTRENNSSTRRPKLTIDFTPGAGTDLTGFEVVFGSHLGGSLDDMKTSNDVSVTTRSKRGFSAFEPNLMEMEVDAATTILAGEALSVTIESRENNPGGIAKIRFRNWDTGAFTQVATYKLGPIDETVTIANLDPSLYVDGNGDIDLSVKHVVIAVFSAIGFDSWFDLIEISVN